MNNIDHNLAAQHRLHRTLASLVPVGQVVLTLLNNFKKNYVRVEAHLESPEMSFWHLFQIEVEEKHF